MPVLHAAVTFARFAVEPSRLASGAALLRAIPVELRARSFDSLDLTGPDERSAGFVELEDHDAVEFSKGAVFHGSHTLFTYRVDELKIHPAMLKAELVRWRKAFEAEQARPPGRREKLEAKAEIRHSLRQRSPVVAKTTDVSWDLDAGELKIWSASRGTIDEAQDAVERAFGVKLRQLVPGVVADTLGLDAGLLAPTPALSLPKTPAPVVAEEQDRAEVEQGSAREQFLRGKAYLGREFLTWLLWRSEAGDPLLSVEGTPLTVLFVDALRLKGITGEVVEETVRGAMSPYSPLVRRALDRGLLVHAARLRLTLGERVYTVSLDAEDLLFRSAKLPALMTDEDDDRIQERLFLADQLGALVHELLEDFLRLRVGAGWAAEVAAMKAWMADGVPEAA